MACKARFSGDYKKNIKKNPYICGFTKAFKLKKYCGLFRGSVSSGTCRHKMCPALIFNQQMSLPMGLPFQVFILGLLTVFVVLLVVVYTGRTIIWFVNRFFEPAPAQTPVRTGSTAALKKGRVAAISAAVHIVTRGKGKVAKIEKL